MQQPVAVITGGGTGIGLATSRRLIEMGWSVWVCGRREAALDAAKVDCPALNTHVCDVSDAASVSTFFEVVSAASNGSVQALMNNAAILSHGDYKTMDKAQMMAQFEVNCVGPLLCVQVALPLMRQGGRILSISSVAAVDPFPGLEVYGMTKAALWPLTTVLNREPGIQAAHVNLGAVDTEMLRSFLPDYEAETKPEQVAQQFASFIAEGKEITL